MHILLPGVVLLLAPAVLAQEYRIGLGDVVHVAVLGQPEMTGDVAVDANGNIPFPFLGKIKAAGLTATELERQVTSLLADGYLKDPHVSVGVKEFHSQRVFVAGEVTRPGPYGLRPERSLLLLLKDVGELTASAGHEVVIVRPPKTDAPASPAPEAKPSGLPGEMPGATVFRVSLRALRSGRPDQDVRLEPGDTIYLPRAAQVYVTGHVGRPGAFRFEEGLTVYQVLNLAGGITERGSAKGVKIVRLVDGRRTELKPKPIDLVRPEDTIVVPERFF